MSARTAGSGDQLGAFLFLEFTNASPMLKNTCGYRHPISRIVKNCIVLVRYWLSQSSLFA